MAILSLAFFVFNLVMRLPEFLIDMLGFRVRFVLGLSIFCALAALASGTFTRVFPSKISFLFTLLAGWVVMSVPFAIWRGGSFSVLVGSWILTAATFYFAAGTPLTLEDCSKLMAAMGLGVLFLLAASFHYVQLSEGRASFDLPSLANPNLFAMQILYGLPFCPLLFRRFPKWLATTLTCGVMFYAGLTLIRTGSRSALLSMAAMSLVLFITATMRRKVFLLIIALLTGLLVISNGSVALNRYRSLFGGGTTSLETVSAQQSSDLRWKLFVQSLEISVLNPVFGVGPGNFSVATADLKRDDQTVAAWLGSHNTPTQFSSEAGIPAGILFLALVGWTVWVNTSIYRKSRRNASPLAADLSLALLFSTIGMWVSCLFASIAYQFYFPLLFGLTVALQRIVEQQAPPALPVRAPFARVAAPRPLPQTVRPPAQAPINPNRLRRPPRNWASRIPPSKPIQKL